MSTGDVATRLYDALEPEAQARGLELVAVEQAGGRGMPVIRVLLDREGGIDLDAVSAANSWVSAIIDAEDPFASPYTLEVSSPGVDRPLTKLADFARFTGEVATLKVAGAGPRTAWTGEIVTVEDDNVVISVDGEPVSVPYSSIVKARLKGVVDFKGKGRS